MAETMQERTGVVTFKGGPLTLIGPEINVGDAAPDATLAGGDLSPVSLAGATPGKAKLIITIPSVDTPVCSLETKKFGEQAKSLPGDVAVYIVSADLPFAMGRWCGAEGVDNLTMLSDYRSMGMARAWGLYLKELGLFARAVYVVGKDGKVAYKEIVSDVAAEPDYDAAITAARAAAG